MTDRINMLETMRLYVANGQDPAFGVYRNQLLGLPDLPGDVNGLREVAGRFKGAGAQIDQVHTDTVKVAKDKLPQLWTGFAAAKAVPAIMAVADRIDEVQLEFDHIAYALDQLADGVEAARRSNETGRNMVVAFLGPGATYASVDEMRTALLAAIDQLHAAAVEHQNAAGRAAEMLRACAGRATAQALAGSGLTAVDRVLLAEVEDADGALLTPADSARAADVIGHWDSDTRQRFDDLLGSCASPAEQAYLVKAVAAGHSMDEVAAFDQQLRPHATDPAWLVDHLRPVDPHGGPAMLNGAELRQSTGTTCGSMSLLVNRAMRDPLYALDLSTPDPGQSMADRIHDEELRIHDETNNGGLPAGYPEFLGTWPYDASTYLNDHSGGVQYNFHPDFMAESANEGRLSTAVTGAANGNPSLLLVGDRWKPDHFLMVVGADQYGNAMVYNPAAGVVESISAGDLEQGRFPPSVVQTRVYGVITPNG